MHPYIIIKKAQNERASSIRRGKLFRKESKQHLYPTYEKDWLILEKTRYDFRHYHIAKCELKGLTRDRIEKPAFNNLPNEKYIDTLKTQIKSEADKYESQDVCIN